MDVLLLLLIVLLLCGGGWGWHAGWWGRPPPGEPGPPYNVAGALIGILLIFVLLALLGPWVPHHRVWW